MKTLITLFGTLLASFFSIVIAQTPGTWSPTGSMIAARHAHTATLLLNGKILICGGVNSSGNYIASAELYDPNTGQWTSTASMTIPRVSHTATLLPDGKVLVVGGQTGACTTTSTAELYDPITGTWNLTGSLQNGTRAGHLAALLTTGALSGKVLVAGGYINQNDGGCGGDAQLSSAELYDPLSGTWANTSEMMIQRDFPIGAVLPNGSLLAIGKTQCCPYKAINNAELYDPNTQLWTSTTNKTTPANEKVVVLQNGKVLVVGGTSGIQPTNVFVSSAEIFDPLNGTWASTTNMSVARVEYTLTRLQDGQVLAAAGHSGGWGVCNELISSEIYNPNSGTWTPTGNMTVTRATYTATLLPNGQVLAAGGRDLFPGGSCSSTILSSAELYTPVCSEIANETLGDGIDNNCNGVVDENNSLRFDGTDDYIDVPNESAFDFTNAMTVEAWIKVSSFTKDWQAIVTKGDKSWRLHRYSNSNFISFAASGISGGALTGTINVNDGQWHHVAAVYDGSHKYLYVDGNLDASSVATGTILNSSYNVAIGENLEQTGRQFNGKIDEVRIWNVARTQAEIQASMNSGICSNTPGLVAYFPFNEGVSGSTNTTVTSADDVTTNNNNGILNGFALTGTSSNWVAGVPNVGAAPEICYNSIDDNCNGQIDEGCVNTIATGTITGSPFCPEAVVSVPFTSVGIFNSGNFYNAELSDKQGLFTAPTIIGTVSSTANSGSVTAEIPSLPVAGSKYRIRVSSTNPEATGTDNGANLKLTACAKPTGLNATSITAASAKVSWTATSCAVKYKVQYRKAGISAWTTKTATTNSYTISGLMANTSYEYRVETYCSNSGSSNSGYTAIYGFTTTLRLGSDVSAEQTMNIYPNPAEELTTVQFSLPQSSHVRVNVYDMSGKEISLLVNNDLLAGDHSIIVNTSDVAKGVYLVRMISDYRIENQKLVVQ
jgi:N-acetylneuraminic acid mutarotase